MMGRERDGAHVREFIVNVVAESRCVDDGERNADAVLLEFWDHLSAMSTPPVVLAHLPTLTGLILMPSSK